MNMTPNGPTGQPNAPEIKDRVTNLQAIFDILAYLHVDARRDGHPELADRLDFAMNYVEGKLKEVKIEL